MSADGSSSPNMFFTSIAFANPKGRLHLMQIAMLHLPLGLANAIEVKHTLGLDEASALMYCKCKTPGDIYRSVVQKAYALDDTYRWRSRMA